MQTRNARGGRLVVWALVAVGLLAAGGGVVGVWSDALWREAELRAARIEREHAALAARQHVLTTGGSGNAWDGYRAAMRALAADDPTPEQRRAALAAFDEGAAAARALAPDLADGLGLDPFAALRLAELVRTAAADAWLDGRRADAANELARLLQFAGDLMWGRTLIAFHCGCAVVDDAADTLLHLDAQRRLDAGSWRLLGKVLAFVDEGVPPLRFLLESEQVWVARETEVGEPFVAATGDGGVVAAAKRRAYRFLLGFALDRQLDVHRALIGTEDLPWPAAAAECERLAHALGESWNPAWSVFACGAWVRMPEATRAVRARLRLLRTVASLRATGEPGRLADPFGGAPGESLQHHREGDELVVASRGADGEEIAVRVGY